MEGTYLCPNCGNMLTESVNKCPNCDYDFGELISCSYKNSENICILTEEPCKIKSLDYEDCEIYQNKFYENIDPEI